MKRAVITGATGVVGSALVKELLMQGHEALVILRKGSPNNSRLLRYVEDVPGWKSLLTIRECSLEHLPDLDNDTGKAWDTFYHLGWTGTKGKDRFDIRIHHANAGYALDAIDLAKRLGCSTFLLAGSQAEYGRTDAVLTPETPTFPENAYGAGKLAAGNATRLYADQLGMKHIRTRILSVYGPNDGERTLVTYLIRSLLAKERPVSTKGEQIWDFLESSDAARALMACAENGKHGAIYLIASGISKPLRDYITEIRDLISPEAEIGFGEVPYGDRQVMHLAADISRTTEDTGWKPSVSFREGILKMTDALRREGQ